MYNIVIWYYYTLQSGCLSKSSYYHHTKLLKCWLYFLFYTLYAPWLIYFTTLSLCFLKTFTDFVHLLTLPPSGSCHLFSVFMSPFLFCFALFVLNFRLHIWVKSCYLFQTYSLSIMHFKSIHCYHKWQDFIPF